jgi:hypothetical protein
LFNVLNYETTNSRIEIDINNVPNKTVVLCSTLSAPLLVISSIPHHILARFKEACLFCKRIVVINRIPITTSAVVKKSVIFIF